MVWELLCFPGTNHYGNSPHHSYPIPFASAAEESTVLVIKKKKRVYSRSEGGSITAALHRDESRASTSPAEQGPPSQTLYPQQLVATADSPEALVTLSVVNHSAHVG